MLSDVNLKKHLNEQVSTVMKKIVSFFLKGGGYMTASPLHVPFLTNDMNPRMSRFFILNWKAETVIKMGDAFREKTC